MKKLLFLIILVSSTVFVYSQAVKKQVRDKQGVPMAVNDFADMLEPFQEEALEKKIRNYYDSTSTGIVIVTVPDLGDFEIEELSIEYLRQWGIGQQGKDNGVLILVSLNDRKARIETGYGMEGVLPDITCKQIIDQRMMPYFKGHDYFRGFDNAVDAIIQAAAGEFKADPKSKKGKGFNKSIIIFLAILFYIIITIISRKGGGGGGTYMSRRGSRGLGGLPWFIPGSMLGGSSGGGWGGGSSGGGGFGGFGGFGGGSGGGGGASGGW